MGEFLGFLYFDTNAFIKYLLPKEKGSDIVKFLVDKADRYNYSLYTSQIGFYEAKRVLKRKVGQPRGHKDYISQEAYDISLHRLRRTLSQIFRLIDRKEPHIEKEQKITYLDVMKDPLFKENPIEERDAKHYTTVFNYLSRFNGLKIVNSDGKFNNFFMKKGFEIINPEEISIKDLEEIL